MTGGGGDERDKGRDGRREAIAAQMALLASRFAARAKTDRAELKRAYEAGDAEAMRHTAHGLAGIAGMFGAQAVGEAAARLEEAVEQSWDAESVEAAWRGLDAELDAVGESAAP